MSVYLSVCPLICLSTKFVCLSPVCLSVSLPACLSCLPACLPFYNISACLFVSNFLSACHASAYLPANLPACTLVPTYLPTCLASCLPACLLVICLSLSPAALPLSRTIFFLKLVYLSYQKTSKQLCLTTLHSSGEGKNHQGFDKIVKGGEA